MPDLPITPSPADLRAAARVSLASFGWTLVASAMAVGLGLADRTLALVAFGLTGLLDAAGSLTLWLHFRYAYRFREVRQSRESMALRLIACGLVTVGLLTSIESIRRLIMEIPAGKSRYGLALAAISAIVLTLLAVRKQRVARLVSSSALKADSYLSAVGAALAGITLVSGVLVTLGEVPWIDAIAALIVSVVATTVGVTEFTREARTLRSVKRANATLISTQRGR